MRRGGNVCLLNKLFYTLCGFIFEKVQFHIELIHDYQNIFCVFELVDEINEIQYFLRICHKIQCLIILLIFPQTVEHNNPHLDHLIDQICILETDLKRCDNSVEIIVNDVAEIDRRDFFCDCETGKYQKSGIECLLVSEEVVQDELPRISDLCIPTVLHQPPLLIVFISARYRQRLSSDFIWGSAITLLKISLT